MIKIWSLSYISDAVNTLWELKGKEEALTLISSQLKTKVNWAAGDCDTLGKYPKILSSFKNELRETRNKIAEHKQEKIKRQTDGTLAPSERRAIASVIEGLEKVESTVLVDIRNTQEAWRKAAARFVEEVQKVRKRKKRRRQPSVTFKQVKQLKKPRLGSWVTAKPTDIGKKCVIVGARDKTQSCGKGKLLKVRFTLPPQGIVDIRVRDQACLNADELEIDENTLTSATTGRIEISVPLNRILVEYTGSDSSETSDDNAASDVEGKCYSTLNVTFDLFYLCKLCKACCNIGSRYFCV